MLTAAASSEEFARAVAPFLQARGFSQPIEISVLRGGANNRVFRVADAQREAVLKHYFKNPNDPRDRFRAEKAFYELLWNCGVRSVPEPLGWDEEVRVGLFTLIRGRKLAPKEVDARRVKEAAAFVVELNRCRTASGAEAIQNASEACFTVPDHLALIDKRVARLETLDASSPLDQEALAFVKTQLTPAWKAIRERILSASPAAASGSAVAKCLSPSDFGFHNALLTERGDLVFFDFEYAGWDDPAKLVCDFFCQPELPASLDHWDDFIGVLAAGLGLDDRWPDRARLLLPAYQVKWCCIMLNDFVRTDQLRRDFALDPGALASRKQKQLEKAKKALDDSRNLRT